MLRGYEGWMPREGEGVPVEPASISEGDMWAKYVSKRRPVVLDGTLDDDAWHGERWTDLDYLKRTAGDATVMVEPIDMRQKVFGTATKRLRMTFAEYIDRVQDPESAGKLYLTTQYELENDSAAAPRPEDDGPELDPIFPTPTHKLAGDFPRHPRVLGELVLQQCNLWLGQSPEGTSSGLHHDFHDNLYVLLSGRKRFVLFPPPAYPYLHVRGTLCFMHKNGLLVYADKEDQDLYTRADGINALDAAHWRLAVLARKLQERDAKRARSRQPQASSFDLEAAYVEAKNEYHRILQEDEEVASEAGSRSPSEDSFTGHITSNDDPLDEVAAAEGEELLAQLGNDAEEAPEPPSFSLIRTHMLHECFNIRPCVLEPLGVRREDLVRPKRGCPRPVVVDLRPGQMLYLPASWFHEVTSFSDNGKPHMAFNYWMHPPDGMGTRHAYKDRETWALIRRLVQEQEH